MGGTGAWGARPRWEPQRRCPPRHPQAPTPHSRTHRLPNALGFRTDIDEFISQNVFMENQLPHKIVNLLFTIANQNIKLTICGAVDFLELINKYIM